MAALAGVVAHGGVGGAVVEALVLIAIAGVFLAVWLRERRSGESSGPQGQARLRDDDEPAS